MRRKGLVQNILRHMVIWSIAFGFFTFFREYGQDITRPLEEANTMTAIERVLFQLLVGSISGMLFGSYQHIVRRYRSEKVSLGRVILYESVGYAVVIVAFILMAFYAFGLFFSAEVDADIIKNFFKSGQAAVLIVYCFLVGFMIEFLEAIDKKFGPGNLLKMLTGQFYRPKQEERVFMFLDMKSSTTIAEQLGHIAYSRLVQDCFKDISVVADHGAEIYQYVGDEAVLTWPIDKGIRDGNCVNAYFAFDDRLRQRKDHYMREYGLVPVFKAGVNLGPITVAEVGDIKREIAYHGDTINTAARIQSKCNAYGERLLVSEAVHQAILPMGSWSFEKQGDIELRGKSQTTAVYAVSRS